MAEKKEPNADGKEWLQDALRTGVWVLTILAVLTVGEFIIAVIAPPWGFILVLVAIFKAFYVIKDYMHIARLWSGEEEAH